MLDLTEIKTRSESITRGPWSATYGPHEPARVWAADTDAEPLALLLGYASQADGKDDAIFIAHAPTDIAALVAEVERLSALLTRSVGSRDLLGGWEGPKPVLGRRFELPTAADDA